MIKRRKKMTRKKTKKMNKQTTNQKDNGLTQLSITAIWKNWNSKTKQPYWIFVTEEGKRIATFNPKVLEELGLSPNEKVINFDFPKTIKVKLIKKGDYTNIETSKPSPASTKTKFQNRSFTPSSFKRQADENIDRMSVLRTAVMFLEYQKKKSLSELMKLTLIFANYVKTGQWQVEK